MSNILRKYVRRILTEEIISVKREDGSEEIWDAEERDGQLVGKKKAVSGGGDLGEERLTTAWKMAKAHTDGSSNGAIYRKIKEIEEMKGSGGIRQEWPGIDWALILLNNEKFGWLDTLKWKPKGGQPGSGKGEATMALAFNSYETDKEPDFWTGPNMPTYSIKYFGNGSGGVMNAGSMGPDVYEALVLFAKSLRFEELLGKEVTTESVVALFGEAANETTGAKSFGTPAMRAWLEKMTAESPLEFNQKDEILISIEKLKEVLITDHGAVGIIAFTDSKVTFIDDGDISNIQINTIRSDRGRIGFKLRGGSPGFARVAGAKETS